MAFPIETRRLFLRPIAQPDRAAIDALCADADAMYWLLDGQTLSPQQVDQWFTSQPGDHLAIVLKQSGETIGFALLVNSGYAPADNEAELTYALNKSHWGVGYAKEAAIAIVDFGFAKRHLGRIIATVDTANRASARILDELGFHKIGSETGFLGLEMQILERLKEGSMTIAPIKLAEKFGQFSDQWHPRVIGDLNESYIKLAKLSGEFIWHSHADEDELFVIVKGRLRMKFRDGEVTVGEGEILVIPKGVEHLPIADEEVHVMLIEPKATKHTGDVQSEKTVAIADQDRI